MIDVDQLKVRVSEFFKKHKIKILIGVVVVILLLLINSLLKMRQSNEPITTRNPFATIMNPAEKFPSKIYIESEALIVNFANHASKGEYEAAYNKLSDECKNEMFGSLTEFTKYAKANFPPKARYEIIPYSKVGTTYIYQVKVFEDFLSTGLTYSDYSYIDLKMAINENVVGEKLLSVGGYIGKFPVNSVFENDYIRIEITQRKSYYSEEIYEVTVTNRTENDIVLRDFKAEVPEVQLSTGGDARQELSQTVNMLLSGYERKLYSLSFARFFDESTTPSSIVFSTIRVVKKGKTENYKESDILAKFSIPVAIVD